jgi:hypothetical protein
MMEAVRRLTAITLGVALLAGAAHAAAAQAPAARAPISKKAASAFIEAVSLQPGDFPARAGVPTPKRLPSATGGSSFTFCESHPTRSPRPVEVADSALSYEHQILLSLVAVMPSSTVARAELAAAGTRSGRRCLVQSLARVEAVETTTRTVRSFARSVRFVPVSAMLGAGAIGVHVLAELPPSAPSAKPVLMRVDAYIFRVGPAEIVFLSIGFGSRLLPATEHALLSLLHSRALAHAL